MVCKVKITAVALTFLLVSTQAVAEIIDGEELVDPTVPLAALLTENEGIGLDLSALYQNIGPENFELSFIRASNTNPMAVINDQRVTVGDIIGGATVTKISRSSVTVQIQDEERVIGLYNTSVKRAVLKK
ncbi:MAG: hypothetical protein ACI8V0_001156 [Pseudohongiellaceae bacterium]